MRPRSTLAVVAVVVALAAIGGGALATRNHTDTATPMDGMSTGTAPAAGNNQQDVMFAQGMIPHHQQAVEMAELAPTRAGSDAIKELASRIAAAQTPEIEQLRGFLKTYGSSEMMSGDHSGHLMMGGIASASDLGKLKAASGTEFDRLFVLLMTAHHEGAIAMAKTELRDGQHAEAKQLAQAIITAQTAEISEMQSLGLSAPVD